MSEYSKNGKLIKDKVRNLDLRKKYEREEDLNSQLYENLPKLFDGGVIEFVDKEQE